MTTHRSIVITFGKDDPVVRSDIDFHRKLTDMRERYPTWSIRGITHERERLIPEKPRSSAHAPDEERTSLLLLPRGKAATYGDMQDGASHGDMQDGDDMRSDDSTGNVVGEAPQEVKPGLRVRVMVPPYNGRRGVVVSVRDENRFQVSVGDGDGSCTSWWCSSDDVVVDRADSEEPAVSLSTLELMSELRRANAALEQEASRYRAAFMKLRMMVGEDTCDAVLASIE
jgi:hypothetical protein